MINVRNKINTIGKYLLYNSERLYLHTKHRYSTSIKKRLIEHSPGKEWQKAYWQFKTQGYAKLPSFLSSEECLKYGSLDKQQLLQMAEEGKLPFVNFSEKIELEKEPFIRNDYGILCQELNSDSPIVRKLEFWKSLEWLIEAYLGNSKFWIRNGPMIISDNTNYKKKKHISNYYHLDLGMHQLGFTVMLLPTNQESTCTEVIPKTHNSSRIGIEFYKHRETKEFIEYAKKKGKETWVKEAFRRYRYNLYFRCR